MDALIKIDSMSKSDVDKMVTKVFLDQAAQSLEAVIQMKDAHGDEMTEMDQTLEDQSDRPEFDDGGEAAVGAAEEEPDLPDPRLPMDRISKGAVFPEPYYIDLRDDKKQATYMIAELEAKIEKQKQKIDEAMQNEASAHRLGALRAWEMRYKAQLRDLKFLAETGVDDMYPTRVAIAATTAVEEPAQQLTDMADEEAPQE